MEQKIQWLARGLLQRHMQKGACRRAEAERMERPEGSEKKERP